MISMTALGKIQGIVSFSPYNSMNNSGVISFKLSSTIKRNKAEIQHNLYVERWGTEEQSKHLETGQQLLVAGFLEENAMGVVVLKATQIEKI